MELENSASTSRILSKFKNPLWILIVLTVIVVAGLMVLIIIPDRINPETTLPLPPPLPSVVPPTSVQKITQTLSETPETTTNKAPISPVILRIYPSLDENLFFVMYTGNLNSEIYSEKTHCIYGIYDKRSYIRNILNLVGDSTIECQVESFGGTGIYGPIISWAEGKKLVIEIERGTIRIIDIINWEAEDYTYNTNELTFIKANRSLDYLLFRNEGVGLFTSYSYSLLDRNKNIVLSNIDFSNNLRPIEYDEVNDGFLFISRFDEDGMQTISFDYLSLDTLVLRNILTTDPRVAEGRGCYPGTLVSEPGEIVHTGGCLSVDPKYRSPDGNIHIKL